MSITAHDIITALTNASYVEREEIRVQIGALALQTVDAPDRREPVIWLDARGDRHTR